MYQRGSEDRGGAGDGGGGVIGTAGAGMGLGLIRSTGDMGKAVRRRRYMADGSVGGKNVTRDYKEASNE